MPSIRLQSIIARSEYAKMSLSSQPSHGIADEVAIPNFFIKVIASFIVSVYSA